MNRLRVRIMTIAISVANAAGCAEDWGAITVDRPDSIGLAVRAEGNVPADCDETGQGFCDESDQGVSDESDQVFDTSVLHEIRIECAPEHIAALEHDHEARVPCTFTFDGVTLENTGIRQKGEGTQLGSLYGKPSFSIRFDEFVPDQKLHGLKKLILNNGGDDPTFLREPIGFDLYQRAGIPSRRSAHAVITFVGLPSGPQVFGVHVMVEAVDKTLLKRLFGQGNHRGNLYEDGDVGDFAGDPYQMDLKDEDEGRTREDLVAFADFVNGATDAEFGARLHEFIDLDATLTSFAIDLVAQHSDGFWHAAHNYYLYNNPVDGRFVMIPHGMDLLFGNVGVCGVVPGPDILSTTLGERMAAHPVLRQRLEAEIARVLDEVWDEDRMEARINELGLLLQASTHNEEAFVEDFASYAASVDMLRAHVRTMQEVWRPAEAPVCGDGIRSGNELCSSMCDDGNTGDGDGCSSQCLVEFCGDGVTQPDLGEACDDEPECQWDCTLLTVCGDGNMQGDEGCDDANDDDDDTCNNDCEPLCEYEEYHGVQYAFCPYEADFHDVNEVCDWLGGTPAVPRSKDEHEWIVDHADEEPDDEWWIGIQRYQDESDWWATDGLPINWYDWASSQPNLDDDDDACVVFDLEKSGRWYDRVCGERHPVVCRLH